MGKPGFSGKRGMKRQNLKVKKGRNAKRNRVNGEQKIVPNAPSKDYSEEKSSIASEDELETKEEEEELMVRRESTMYDDLLKRLGSSSELVANALRRRTREEEGRSDSDDNGSEAFDSLGDESNGDEPSSSTEVENRREGSTKVGLSEKVESSGADDDDGIGESDTDEESESRTSAQLTAEAFLNSSAFSSHLGYKLKQEEIENLLRRKWSYKWEVPAFGMSNCKWKGTGNCFLKEVEINSCNGLKPRLHKHWLDIYRGAGGSDFDSSKQRMFFSICNSYRDILHHNKKPYYLKGSEEDSAVMDAYIMHSLNHIFRTRDLVAKNDSKVANSQSSSAGDILSSNSFLDHGFTRPKILILLPLASIAFRVVKRLIQLTPPKHKVSVENIDRFTEEFGSGGNEEEQDDIDVEDSKTKKSSKPSDFQALFGGNNNDHFMIGIKYLGRRIRLYGDFYSSDIIVASPLGLITKIGEAEAEKEKDVDHLSSIEVLIIDHADVILMQNWSHVNTVIEHLNRIPSKQHGTDIMRIRPWYLDGQAQFYRQTIILGSHLNPDINAVFNHQCLNYQGKVRLACDFKGVLPKIMLPVRQVYERFDADSIADAEDARFDYFCRKIFPKTKDSIQGGIMIFVSSYFEFVRLRNFLKSQDASFSLLGEYTKQNDISRARVWFFQGQRKIMLYSERAHFYHRYKIRAVQNLIIFSLPERKEFYPEIVNMLEGSHDMTCTVLFSRFDQFRLERIVGSAPAKRMLTSEKSVFVFC